MKNVKREPTRVFSSFEEKPRHMEGEHNHLHSQELNSKKMKRIQKLFKFKRELWINPTN